MTRTTTAIIGAGQCGLAMSRVLTKRGIDHVLIEAGRAGDSWRSRRWASLRLLSPNWMTGLADAPYAGDDPNGFMHCRDFASVFDAWTMQYCPPLICGEAVQSLTIGPFGFTLTTDSQQIEARSVVVATGQCALSQRPAFARDLPPHIHQLSPFDYKSPSELPDGGVLIIGAAASGLQLARELRLAGRRVLLSVGEHSRLPRRYRGEDILTWMTLAGVLDEQLSADSDLQRLRRLPSLPLIGDPNHIDIDLNALQDIGIEITGRYMAHRGDEALFSGSLARACTSADLKMLRLLDRIDAWIDAHLPFPMPPAERPNPLRCPASPRLACNLAAEGITNVLWATGFRPDHGFIDLPVFDQKGRLQHQSGVVTPGLYALGLSHLRTAQSTHIAGAYSDAQAVAEHLVTHLAHQSAA